MNTGERHHWFREAAQQTPDDLAVELSEDPAWLKRKLYGQTPADIGDLMKWALRYGISVLPAIDSIKELRPSSNVQIASSFVLHSEQ